jgi:hypothetical protein
MIFYSSLLLLPSSDVTKLLCDKIFEHHKFSTSTGAYSILMNYFHFHFTFSRLAFQKNKEWRKAERFTCSKKKSLLFEVLLFTVKRRKNFLSGGLPQTMIFHSCVSLFELKFDLISDRFLNEIPCFIFRNLFLEFL